MLRIKLHKFVTKIYMETRNGDAFQLYFKIKNDHKIILSLVDALVE